MWRSKEIYQKPIRTTGAAHRPDARYGHFSQPHSLSHNSHKPGESVPAIHDEDGFRIPYELETTSRSGLKILFLGDSLTFGYGVPAEKTFSYLTAEQLGVSAMNAGVPGWGLSQILLRAQDEIPDDGPQRLARSPYRKTPRGR